MKETIYLRVSRRKVEQMTKSLPGLYKGEIPVKLNIEVKDVAFREPVIEQTVVIEDWTTGIDIADVEFNKAIITDKEAETIRQQRLERMAMILKEQGYEVSKAESGTEVKLLS